VSEGEEEPNNKDTKVSQKRDKIHSIVIYGFTTAIFAYLISTSFDSSGGFTFKLEQVALIGAVIGLLLFRYFDVIKFGNVLELSNKVADVKEKAEQEGTSFAEDIEEIQKKIENLESKHDYTEEKEEAKSETAGEGTSIMEKYSKSKSIQEKVKISEKVYKKSEKSLEDKEKDCILLLEDPDWRWRTKKKLKRDSGLSEPEFKNFINKNRTSANAIVKSTIPDRLGNELYRLKRRRK